MSKKPKPRLTTDHMAGDPIAFLTHAEHAALDVLPYQRRLLEVLSRGPVRLVLLGRRSMQWSIIPDRRTKKR